MLVFVLFLIFNCEFIEVIALDSTEGDECTLESGEKGSCTNGYECEYAINLVASGQRPKICGFDGKTPIVCCLQKSRLLLQPVRERGALSDRRGDECTLESGEKGSCTNGYECEYAINLIASGQSPKICGFDGKTPIVCCIQKAKRLPQPVRERGALSNRKCREFPIVAAKFVYGGKQADPAEFPHMALVGFGEKNNIQWQCGGSLISLNYVMTAAHCLQSRELGSARWVRMGDLDISTDTDKTKHQQFQIKRLVSHPQYDPPSRYNDIALLELEHSVLISQYVYPACLDTSRNHDKGTGMLITGWGKSAFIGETSNHLLKATVHLVPNADCRTHYRNEDTSQLSNGIVDELQICAGGNSMEDTCQGDSGGPLMIMKPNKTDRSRYRIVGVTSFGQACGISRSPGVYTRVYHYLTWIENIIWP